MLRAQQPRRLGRRRCRVLDRLRLVEDDVVELDVLQMADVPPQRAIRREDDVVLGQLVEAVSPPLAAVVEHAQPRSKACRLALPVEHERSRHDDERRLRGAAFTLSLFAPRFQGSQDHDGLAEPHFVGQAAAKAKAPQELEPRERVGLVVTQGAAEARRRFHGLDALEAHQFLPHARKSLVAGNGRLRRQPGIEQRTLRRGEAHVVGFGDAQGGDAAVTRQPVGRHHAEGAIAQAHEGLAAARRRQQRRQIRAHPFVVDRAVELEPVDARAHVQRDASRRPIDSAVGFDFPALAHESRNERRKHARRQVQSRAAALPVRERSNAERLQPRERLPFGSWISAPGQMPSAVEEHRRRRPDSGFDATVGERQGGFEAIARRVAWIFRRAENSRAVSGAAGRSRSRRESRLETEDAPGRMRPASRRAPLPRMREP